jgi:hypothetical protein
VTTRLSSADVETIAALDATAQAALVRDREVPAVLDDEADVWPSPTLGALSLPIGVMGVDPADPWKGNAEAGDVVSFRSSWRT